MNKSPQSSSNPVQVSSISAHCSTVFRPAAHLSRFRAQPDALIWQKMEPSIESEIRKGDKTEAFTAMPIQAEIRNKTQTTEALISPKQHPCCCSWSLIDWTFCNRLQYLLRHFCNVKFESLSKVDSFFTWHLQPAMQASAGINAMFMMDNIGSNHASKVLSKPFAGVSNPDCDGFIFYKSSDILREWENPFVDIDNPTCCTIDDKFAVES